MLSETSTIKFDDLITDKYGISVGVMYPGKDTPGGVPLIRAGDIQESGINPSINFRIAEQVNSSYKRTQLEGGELLITLVGNPGIVVVVPDYMAGFNAARAVAVVRLKNPAEGLFIKAAFAAPQVKHTISSVLNTTVQATLNLKDIKDLRLPWPDANTRHAISRILGALDDKIEVNRKAAATLEAMARALYRSWFVDFDPVHAKAEGRQPAHMDAATSALFPDRFGDNGLPLGWDVVSFADACVQNKRTVKPMEQPDAHFWHYSLPAFDEGKAPLLEAGSLIKSNKLDVPHDAILFSRLNPSIPRVWWARPDTCKGISASSTEFFVATARTGVETPWLYCLMSSAEFREEALARVTGTSNSHQRVSAGVLSRVEVTLPSAGPLKAFWRESGPWFERVHSLSAENRTLANLRDTLLPRLMSGELRVGAAEKIVSEAV